MSISELFFANLKKFAEEHKFDAGHGYDHFITVYNHAKKAIKAEDEELDKKTERMILLSCLLHDVDDSKFFGDPALTNYKNARELLATEYVLPSEVETIIYMISLVSCSKNVNNRPPNIPDWMLIPRHCDRLEASGKIGLERAISYGNHVGRAMYDETTPRVHSLEELNKVAPPEKFLNYLDKSTHGKTTIDQIYDKIYHITNPKTMGTFNTYILSQAEERHNYVVDYILNFWKTHE